MRLLRANTGTFKEDAQLEIGTCSLGIKVTSAAGITSAVFNAMKLQVSLVSKTGNIKTLPLLPLRFLLNASSMAEGSFQWTSTILFGTVDLSKVGCVQLADGEYMSVKYEGFPDDAVTDIWAIDSQNHYRQALVFESISINRTSKELNVASKSDLYLPITESSIGIEQIEIQYPNRKVTMLEDELKLINQRTNDVVFFKEDGDGGLKAQYGYDKFLHLDITDALSIIVTPIDGTSFTVYTAHEIAY
jgi:hypothetical protein